MTDNPSSTPIPLVDFSVWMSSNVPSEDRVIAAKQLVSACHETGFAYVKNHGVSPKLLEDMFAWNNKFHDLPQDQKMQVQWRQDDKSLLGYSRPGIEMASKMYGKIPEGQKAPEEIMALNEVYKVTGAGNSNYQNQWLPETILPGFRDDVDKFYQECWKVSVQILRALAIGIGLNDEDTFLPYHSSAINILALRHYPSIDTKAVKDLGFERLGLHRDFTPSVTLLFQDELGGLEVQKHGLPGEYIKVHPIKDTLVMNIGDVLMRWTNDYLLSTIHRVNLPWDAEEELLAKTTGGMTKDRYSIPFFVSPKPDTMMECLPQCCSETNPPKYPPTSYQDYVKKCVEQVYK